MWLTHHVFHVIWPTVIILSTGAVPGILMLEKGQNGTHAPVMYPYLAPTRLYPAVLLAVARAVGRSF